MDYRLYALLKIARNDEADAANAELAAWNKSHPNFTKVRNTLTGKDQPKSVGTHNDQELAGTEANQHFERRRNSRGMGDLDWMQLALAGGGALLGHSIGSSLFDDSEEEKKKRSIWSRLLATLIPLGVGGLGAYGGYVLGNSMKKSAAGPSNYDEAYKEMGDEWLSKAIPARDKNRRGESGEMGKAVAGYGTGAVSLIPTIYGAKNWIGASRRLSALKDLSTEWEGKYGPLLTEQKNLQQAMPLYEAEAAHAANKANFATARANRYADRLAKARAAVQANNKINAKAINNNQKQLEKVDPKLEAKAERHAGIADRSATAAKNSARVVENGKTRLAQIASELEKNPAPQLVNKAGTRWNGVRRVVARWPKLTTLLGLTGTVGGGIVGEAYRENANEYSAKAEELDKQIADYLNTK